MLRAVVRAVAVVHCHKLRRRGRGGGIAFKRSSLVSVSQYFFILKARTHSSIAGQYCRATLQGCRKESNRRGRHVACTRAQRAALAGCGCAQRPYCTCKHSSCHRLALISPGGHSTAQHSAARYSTARHRTAQRSTRLTPDAVGGAHIKVGYHCVPVLHVRAVACGSRAGRSGQAGAGTSGSS